MPTAQYWWYGWSGWGNGEVTDRSQKKDQRKCSTCNRKFSSSFKEGEFFKFGGRDLIFKCWKSAKSHCWATKLNSSWMLVVLVLIFRNHVTQPSIHGNGTDDTWNFVFRKDCTRLQVSLSLFILELVRKLTAERQFHVSEFFKTDGELQNKMPSSG